MKIPWIFLCIFLTVLKIHKIEGKTQCPEPKKLYQCTGDTAFLTAYGTIVKNVPYHWFKLSRIMSTNIREGFIDRKADVRPDDVDDKFKNDITNKVLMIKKLHPEDAGIYAYRPSDTKDTNAICIDFELKVLRKELRAHPNGFQTVENGNVQLKVEAFHTGTPEWYLNGKLLPSSENQVAPSKHYKYVNSRQYGYNYGSVLEIKNIQMRHKGDYKLKWIMDGVCKENSIKIDVKVLSLQDYQKHKEELASALDADRKTHQPKSVQIEEVLKALNKVYGTDVFLKIHSKSSSHHSIFLVFFALLVLMGMSVGTYFYYMFYKKRKRTLQPDTNGKMFAEDFRKGQTPAYVQYQPLSTIEEVEDGNYYYNMQDQSQRLDAP